MIKTMRLIRCLQFPGKPQPLYLCPKNDVKNEDSLSMKQVTEWADHLLDKKVVILSPSFEQNSFAENAVRVKALEAILKSDVIQGVIGAETISCFSYVTDDNGVTSSYKECVAVVTHDAESSPDTQGTDVSKTVDDNFNKILAASDQFYETEIDVFISNFGINKPGIIMSSLDGNLEMVPIVPPQLHPAFVACTTNSASHSLTEILEKLKPFEHMEEVKDLKSICDTFLQNKTEIPSSSHPVIVIEGLDATGKSTLSENLSLKTGGKLLKSPPDCVVHLREAFDKLPSPLRRLYYSLSNYVFGEMIKKSSQTGVVICDRFWHSTAAYAIATDVKTGDASNLPPKNHWVYNWPDDLLKPDLVYFLSVSEEERIRRLKARNIKFTDEEKWLISSKHFKERMDECYSRMKNPSVVTVDAAKGKTELCDFILANLKIRGLI